MRRLAKRLRLALEQADELERQIGTRAAANCSPLGRWCGINLLTAGARAGILGPGQRCTTAAHLAASAGAAPMEASSAGGVRHRRNRGGNRRLNAIRSRIAVTQARHRPAAQASRDRRQAAGKPAAAAFRARTRCIVRAIGRLWQECLTQHAATPAGVAA